MGRTVSVFVFLALALSACAPHGAPSSAKPPAGEPGTMNVVASAGSLTDAASGDTYTKLDDTHPARIALTGPERFQADFRLAFDGEPAGAVLVLHANDTPVQAYKLQTKSGGTWKEGGKSSVPTGFFIDVPAGTQQWELRVRGGAGLAGGIRLVPASKARVPLAATAPVLTLRVAAAAAPTATPLATTPVAATPAASATPAATAVATTSTNATDRSFAVEAAAVGMVRWSARRFDPVAPGLAVTALRPVAVEGLSAGAAIGWRHHTGGRTFEEFHGRVAAPYVADVDAIPIEAVARYTRPVGGVLGVAQAGAGLEYAHSSYARADLLPRRVRENDWAATFSTSAGAQMPLLGGAFGARIGVRFARHAFAAHDFELLHGVETTAAWQRSF